MRLFGAIVIVTGFALFWIFVAVYWTGYQAKRLSSKQGRQEIKTEVTEAVSFIAKDKDFHRAANQEFRGLYIVIGLVVVALIASALGLG